MSHLSKIARNCYSTLSKASRSASRRTQDAVAPLLVDVYEKLIRTASQEKGSADIWRHVSAVLTQINLLLIEERITCDVTKSLAQLNKDIVLAYPPPAIAREKAKPTIRLHTKNG